MGGTTRLIRDEFQYLYRFCRRNPHYCHWHFFQTYNDTNTTVEVWWNAIPTSPRVNYATSSEAMGADKHHILRTGERAHRRYGTLDFEDTHEVCVKYVLPIQHPYYDGQERTACMAAQPGRIFDVSWITMVWEPWNLVMEPWSDFWSELPEAQHRCFDAGYFTLRDMYKTREEKEAYDEQFTQIGMVSDEHAEEYKPWIKEAIELNMKDLGFKNDGWSGGRHHVQEEEADYNKQIFMPPDDAPGVPMPEWMGKKARAVNDIWGIPKALYQQNIHFEYLTPCLIAVVFLVLTWISIQKLCKLGGSCKTKLPESRRNLAELRANLVGPAPNLAETWDL